jgi:putative transposase
VHVSGYLHSTITLWAYDFVADRTVAGRALKVLTVIDEFSRQCLAIPVAGRLNSDDVLVTLTDLFVVAAGFHSLR